MKNQKQTIRKIVGFLNNPDEEGGFWLPNIQRPFVWREEQLCRLFDSILREWNENACFIGQMVEANGKRGRVFGLNEDGALRLDIGLIYSGEVRGLRAVDGN